MTAPPFRIAACQYPVEPLPLPDQSAWAAKLTALVASGAASGARLLLFPELSSLELAAWQPPAIRADPAASLEALQERLPDYLALHAELARRHRIYLLAGSYPVRVGARYRNRALLFGPDGRHGWQDKLILTPVERAYGQLARGEDLTLFQTALGGLGILVCYDSEFPLLARALAAAGAELLLVPSCTDGWAGYHRVRIACQARALEGQCHVAQSPTIGDAPWSPILDVNRGRAGIFGPPDRGFPADGIIAIGQDDMPGWVGAELDPGRIRDVRAAGQVRNYCDWDRQPTPIDQIVARLVRL